MKNNKLILLAVAVFFLLFAINFSKAESEKNVSGWLWGGSDDGVGNKTGLGWISANNVTGLGAISYGLSMPETDGNLSGYVWSENVGWISFNMVDISGCPDGNCFVQRSGNNLMGWARIMSIPQAGANAGGWQGWIRLNPNFGGVSINPSNNILMGYAWSDELGWIDFSRAALKTIQGSVSANPNSVTDATTLVAITATITGGTASGNNIKYELDCTNNGIIEKTYDSTTGELSHIFSGVDACTYGASSYAAVRITRDGVSITPTALVSLCTHSNACAATTCIGNKCSDSCGTQYDGTKDCRNENWQEVSPN